MHRLVLLLLIGTVTLTAAHSPFHCCSRSDREVILKQWRSLFDQQDSRFRAGIGRILLLKIIEAHPEAAALFKRVDVDHPDGPEFTAHSYRVFNGLDMAINLLEDPHNTHAALDHLAEQHAGRPGIKQVYFTTMADTIHKALPQLMDQYNSIAWRSCLGAVLHRMAHKLHE